MDPNWIIPLVVLLFHTGLTSAEVKLVKEGETVEITCRPEGTAATVFWFRVLDGSGVNFIASFGSVNKELKKSGSSFSSFSVTKMSSNILTLKSFEEKSDSGIYSCGILKGNELGFGKATRISAIKTTTPKPAPLPSATADTPVSTQSTTSCACHSQRGILSCPLVILAPLVGGCGLLLLLLIVTALYCNRIRTRRCPHHYKRKPRMMAPDKQMMVNSRI